MTSRRRFVLLLTCALGACEAPNPAAPALEAPFLMASSGPSLLICPSNDTESGGGLVSALGGTVSLAGHSVQVPLGGLLSDTEIQITEPASQYLEVALGANGLEHFEFELPVLVTISYARCSRSNLDLRPLEVWYIDPATHELIEPMGGIDDKLTRSVSFWTDHFSGYAIAESRPPR
jgi:hypothetical protein